MYLLRHFLLPAGLVALTAVIPSAPRHTVVPRVVPHNVALAPTVHQKVNEPIRMVTGSFSLNVPRNGGGQSGGACLIYRSLRRPVLTHQCTEHADCAFITGVGAPKDTPSPIIRHYAYCAPTTDDKKGYKVCWRKPDPESCVRRPTHATGLVAGQVMKLPATPMYPKNVGNPIAWRVVTCRADEDLACGNLTEGKYHYEFGPVSSYP